MRMLNNERTFKQQRSYFSLEKSESFFWPFVNLGIGISALELELELGLELIQQTPSFPVPLGLWTLNRAGWWFRARLNDIRSELKPVWNLKSLWNVVPFTWQFTWRFHCGNFPNNSKTLLHMWKWYILIMQT